MHKWPWQIHLDITLKERPQRLITFVTFDQSDEETLPDTQKDNDNDKYNEKDKNIDNCKTPSKNNLRDL